MLLFMIAPTWIIENIENTVALEIKKTHNPALKRDAPTARPLAPR
jgi:hypothetical protein